MEEMQNPKAAWYAAMLEKYRAGGSAAGLGPANPTVPGAAQDMLMVEAPMASLWASSGARTPEGPGLLRTAVSATRAMAQFVGSGFKTAEPRLAQHRLRTCAACEHHTGLRCRLCGCFTSAKARLAYEECPIGKWQR
jgi:hypothetical protein